MGLTKCRCSCCPAALEHVAKDTAGTLWWGMYPPKGAGFTATDYAVALKLLLSSPHRAVYQADVVANLPGGLAALDAMIEADLLALRPYSGESLRLELGRTQQMTAWLSTAAGTRNIIPCFVVGRGFHLQPHAVASPIPPVRMRV